MSPEPEAPQPITRDVLIDEVDAQVWMLGRMFSARHLEIGAGGAAQCVDMPMTQYVLLRSLAEFGPMKMADIAAAVGTKAPAASSLVDHAQKAGYVVREPDAADRRVVNVALTDAGRAALARVEAHRREMIRHYTSVLSEEDLTALIRIQRTLIGALGAERV